LSYDIAVGRCTGVTEQHALVKVEGAMLRRLRPGQAFGVQTKACLRVPLSVCSKQRTPRAGEELYLDYDSVSAGAEASLDVEGDGQFVPADIRLLVDKLDPIPRPQPSQKHRAANWPIRH
jgi:hypothetical protein